MRRSSVFVPAVLAGLSVGATAAYAAPVDFHLVAQDVSVDRATSTATFALTFDKKPNFIAMQGDGQSQAFQYEIDADTATLTRSIDFSDVDTVIRGSEIFEGHGIPIRNRDGDGGANSGGWGPVRALLPFETDGNTVKFTTDLAAIGDTDGQFRYRVFTTDNGALTGQVVGAVIPLPAPIWTGVTMLGALGAALTIRKLPRIV